MSLTGRLKRIEKLCRDSAANAESDDKYGMDKLIQDYAERFFATATEEEIKRALAEQELILGLADNRASDLPGSPDFEGPSGEQ